MIRRRITKYSREVELWAEEIEACMFCFGPVPVVGNLQKCHIIGRGKRRNDTRWNLVLGCDRCHRCDRGPKDPGWPDLKLEHYLFVKVTLDPFFYDPDLLEHLYCRTLPQPRVLPARFWEERAGRRPLEVNYA